MQETYVIEITRVKSFLWDKGRKKGKPFLHRVFAMLLKTHIEKMSAFRSLAMLMKIS